MCCAQPLGEAAQLLWWACGSAARADARQQRHVPCSPAKAQVSGWGSHLLACHQNNHKAQAARLLHDRVARLVAEWQWTCPAPLAHPPTPGC